MLFNIRKMIDDIHNELIKEMSKTELLSYYQDNGLLLEKYYSDNSHQIPGQENDHTDENSILMYFTQKMDNKDNSKKKSN